MYRTLEHMTVRNPAGGTIDLAPGDPIADFEDWSPWTQHCLVDEKRVRWAPEGITDAERRRARPPQPAPVVPPSPAATLEPQLVGEPITDELPPLVGEPATGLRPVIQDRVTPARMVEPKESAVKGPLACTVCDRSGFKDATGLKIHMNKAHKNG